MSCFLDLSSNNPREHGIGSTLQYFFNFGKSHFSATCLIHYFDAAKVTLLFGSTLKIQSVIKDLYVQFLDLLYKARYFQVFRSILASFVRAGHIRFNENLRVVIIAQKNIHYGGI